MSTLPREALRVPRRIDALSFWLRSRAHIALRGLRNAFDASLHRWQADDALRDAPVLAESRTRLWTDHDAAEFALIAGKVHNLRIAMRAFDGVVVPAGVVMSFWRQLGRPGRRRGFVRGRELRSGCMVPAVAGGICQLSNALADCAHRAGIEAVERHAHSVRIAATPTFADATVFWNYVDLRLRAPHAWRIEARLDADALIVRLRGHDALRETRAGDAPPRDDADQGSARSCLSCAQNGCFRHQPSRPVASREAWLLDEWTPEFAAFLERRTAPADRFVPRLPSLLRRWQRAPTRWTWDEAWSPQWLCARNALLVRLQARRQGRRQAAIVAAQRRLARAYARKLRIEHTHLVVAQSLLPHLHASGALGGRSYEVLAAALPMREVQRCLDDAHQACADATLVDFRVPETVLAAEDAAFEQAARIVTPHAAIAAHWRARGLAVHAVPWSLPAARRSAPADGDAVPLVVFPASELARKGLFELAAALQGLRCRVRVLGTPLMHAQPWGDLAVEYAGYGSDWLAGAAVVVLPAHVEHAPRALLAAVAAGVPVIATPACGVEAGERVRLVPPGDIAALTAALRAVGLRDTPAMRIAQS